MNERHETMSGLSRAEVDRLESRDFALGKGPARPCDAATLILLDRRAGDICVLMGRRHAAHAFMPGKFVFPGGRTDPGDGRVPVAAGLHPAEEAKLTGPEARVTAARARAIALSAIRETYEEAGLLIGRKGDFASGRPDWRGFREHGVRPSLDGLRFIARAVTPPGRVRRFDTRFLSAWREEVATELAGGGPSGELEELAWLPLREAKEADVPTITRTVLADMERRIADDPELRPGGAVPFYAMRGNRMSRLLL